jgi:hypothetical protein
MRRMLLLGLVLVALILGLLLALMDTRPGWNDTGISAFALLAVCAVFGMVSPGRAWLWVLAVGLWMPLLNIAFYHNYGAILAIAFAFVGAYAGAFARKLLTAPGETV